MIRAWIFVLICTIASLQTGWAQDDEPTAAPGPSSFATDPDQLGALANSVNLFTGQVSLPIPLVSLPGRDGLNVSVSAAYSSVGIDRQVDTWNRDAPTGVLGLGWNFSFPQIVANHKGTGTTNDDEYFLVSGGSSSRLVFEADEGSYYSYVLQGDPFQRIRYYPSDEKWEIVDGNGATSTYGDKNDSNWNIRWAVRWGNYAGNSGLTSGQSRFAVAWNLSKIESRTGATIDYDYLAIMRAVGDGGLRQTEAVYLKEITDTYGRTVVFHYGDKDSGEYVEPHTEILGGQEDNTEGDAYQEQYETKFLDRIEVVSEFDNLLFSIEMGYQASHLNECGSSCDKRLLTSITHKNADGDPLPSIGFEYAQSGTRKGYLADITTSTGGQVGFEYDDVDLASSNLDIELSAPAGMSQPRVWIGEDYVVVTWRSTTGNSTRLEVYRWEGEWVAWPEYRYFNVERSATTDLQLLDVHLGIDFFAVVAKPNSNAEFELFLFHKDPTDRSGWIESDGVEVWDYEPDAQRVAVGDNFAVTALYDGGAVRFVTFEWNGQSWVEEIHRTLSGYNMYQIAGQGNYFIALEGVSNTTFSHFHRDQSGEWTESLGASLSGSAEEYSITPALTSVVLAKEDGNNIVYLYDWDESYSSIGRTSPGYADNAQVLLGGLSTIGVVGDSNFRRVLRYDGVSWDIADFSSSPAQDASLFSFGEDFAVRTDPDDDYGGDRLIYNANSAHWNSTIVDLPGSTFPGPQDGTFPRAGVGQHLLGGQIYFRSPSLWNSSQNLVPTSTSIDTRTLQQVGNSAATYENEFTFVSDVVVAHLRNNEVVDHSVIEDSRVLARPNFLDDFGDKSYLTGRSTLVTYSSDFSRDEFHDVTELVIHRIVNEEVSGSQSRPVVAEVLSSDGFKEYMVEYEYEEDYSTIDSRGLSPQFNKVTVIPRDPDSPMEKPAGYTEHFFFTGLEPPSNHPATSDVDALLVDYVSGYGNAAENRSFVRGLQYSARILNSANELIRDERTIWHVFKTWEAGEESDLIQFVRSVASFSESTNHAIKTSEVYVYENDTTEEVETGLVEITYSIGQYDTGSLVVVETENTYWWELYDTDLSEHLFSPVVASRSTVDGTVVSSTGTVWTDNWNGSFSEPAPGASYVWLGTGSSMWNGSPNSNWRTTSAVTERDEFGNAVESEDVDGRPSATIYAAEGGVPVASFTNARRSGVFADNFDDLVLEDGSTGPGDWWVYNGGTGPGWIHDGTLHWDDLSGVGIITTDVTLDQVDFIADFRVRVEEDSGWYFSFRFRKTARHHDPNQSGYTLKFRDDGQIRLESSTLGILSTGSWGRVHDWHRVRVSVEGQQIQVYVDGERVINYTDATYPPAAAEDTYAGFRFQYTEAQVDDFRLYPLSAVAESSSYDRDTRRSEYSISSTGTAAFSSYDRFNRHVESRRFDGLVMSESSMYDSRIHDASGEFDPDDPHATYSRSFRYGNPVRNGSFELGEINSEPVDWPIWAAVDNVERRDVVATDAPTGGYVMEVEAGDDEDWGVNHSALYAPDYFQPSSPYIISFWARCVTGTCDVRSVISKQGEQGYYASATSSTVTPGSTWQRYVLTVSTGSQSGWTRPRNNSYVRLDVWKNSVVQFDDVQVIEGDEMVHPAKTVSYVDAFGKPIQSQSVDGSGHIISATLYDALSRGHITTKPIRFTGVLPGFSPGLTPGIFNYYSNFATYSSTTGEVSGLVDSYYSSDQGYPFIRTVYEESPVGRPVEESQPGYDYRIGGGNTTVYEYERTSNSSPLGITGSYIQTTVTNPDGVESRSLKDRLGRTVATISDQVFAEFYQGSTVNVTEPKPDETFQVTVDQTVSWTADFEEGVVQPEFTVGTTPGGSNILSYAPGGTVPAGGLHAEGTFAVASGTTYYVHVDGNTDALISGPEEALQGSVTFSEQSSGTVNLYSLSIHDVYGNVVDSRPPGYYWRPTPIATPEDYVTTSTFDQLGQLLSSTTPDGGTVRNVYDDAGRRRFSMDDVGYTPNPEKPDLIQYWKYDERGRLIEEGYISDDWDRPTFEAYANNASWPTTPDTWRRQFVYGADDAEPHKAGALLEILTNNDDDNSAEVEERYAASVYGESTTYTLEVDEDGQGLIANPDAELEYDYDHAGNLLKVTYPHSLEVYYERDEQGRTVSVGSDTNPDLYASYTYGTFGQILTEVLDDGRLTRTNDYDSDGRIEEIDYSDSGGVVFNEEIAYGVTDDCSRPNRVRRITELAFSGTLGGTADYDVEFCYDIAGRMVQAQHVSTDVSLQTYNLGIYQEHLRYDANGNLAVMTQGSSGSGTADSHALYLGTNQLANTDGAGTDYRYDGVGRMVENVPENMSLTYDVFFGRVVSMEEKTSPITADYMYGSEDRVFKAVTEGTGRFELLYGRGPDTSPLFEREQHFVSESLTDQDLVFYVYGPSGVIAREVRSGLTPPSSGDVSFIVKDHLGSNRLFLEQSTGTVEAAYDYSPFGDIMRSAVTIESRYTYTGQESDGESGLLNYHARLYDTGIARFAATDPAGQFNSPYSYVGYNPVSFTDPNGEFAWFVAAAAVFGGLTRGISAYRSSGGDFLFTAVNAVLGAAGSGISAQAGKSFAGFGSALSPRISVASGKAVYGAAVGGAIEGGVGLTVNYLASADSYSLGGITSSFALGLGLGLGISASQWIISSGYRWSHIEAAGHYAYENGGAQNLVDYLVSEIGGDVPKKVRYVGTEFFGGAGRYYAENQLIKLHTSAFINPNIGRDISVNTKEYFRLLTSQTLDVSRAYSVVEHEIWHHRLARKVGFKLTALQSHKFVPAHHYLISDHQVNGQYFSSFSSSVRRGLVDARHLYEARYAVLMPGGAGYWDHRSIARRYDLCSVLRCW